MIIIFFIRYNNSIISSNIQHKNGFQTISVLITKYVSD